MEDEKIQWAFNERGKGRLVWPWPLAYSKDEDSFPVYRKSKVFWYNPEIKSRQRAEILGIPSAGRRFSLVWSCYSFNVCWESLVSLGKKGVFDAAPVKSRIETLIEIAAANLAGMSLARLVWPWPLAYSKDEDSFPVYRKSMVFWYNPEIKSRQRAEILGIPSAGRRFSLVWSCYSFNVCWESLVSLGKKGVFDAAPVKSRIETLIEIAAANLAGMSLARLVWPWPLAYSKDEDSFVVYRKSVVFWYNQIKSRQRAEILGIPSAGRRFSLVWSCYSFNVCWESLVSLGKKGVFDAAPVKSRIETLIEIAAANLAGMSLARLAFGFPLYLSTWLLFSTFADQINLLQ